MKPVEKIDSIKILNGGGLSQIAIASTMLPGTLRNDPADQIIVATAPTGSRSACMAWLYGLEPGRGETYDHAFCVSR